MKRFVALVLLVAAAGTLVVLSRHSDPPPVRSVASLAPGAVSGEELAAAACIRLRLAQQGILANSSADTVRGELAEARVLAAAAVTKDSAFTALSGGAAALDEALRRDAPGAASLAVRVVRASCGGG